MENYIPVEVDNLPDIFDIELAGEVFTFRFDYSSVTDYYTVTIIKDGKVLLAQEPLLLGNLIGETIPNTDLPWTDLRVLDPTGRATDAGKGKFGVSVQLYLDVKDPNGSEDENPDNVPLGYDPDEQANDLTDSEVDI
ncbi:hypothetical protein EFM11_02260 [Lactobacillus helveticus]|nr:hypothetical protein [Lactobacillus helveticus]MCT0164382.1 hypothetical protein [Lactobacillus helveticus]